MWIFIGGVAILFLLLLKPNRSNNSSNYVEYNGVVFAKEWWPKLKLLKRISLLVKTKDLDKVLESEVSINNFFRYKGLKNEYDKSELQNAYMYEFDGGEVTYYDDDLYETRFFMNKRTKALYDNKRLFFKWNKSVRAIEGDKKNTWELHLNAYEMTSPFPFDRTKDDSFYINKRTFNNILKKDISDEEKMILIEAKFSSK